MAAGEVEQMAEQKCGGGFAVGAGDAQNIHLFVRFAGDEAVETAYGFADVGNQIIFHLGSVFRQLFGVDHCRSSVADCLGDIESAVIFDTVDGGEDGVVVHKTGVNAEFTGESVSFYIACSDQDIL